MSAERCPNCNALLRSGDLWCSQCLADLRPEEERQPAAGLTTPGGQGQRRPRHGKHAKPNRVQRLVSSAGALIEESPTAVRPTFEAVADEEWELAVQAAPLREAPRREAPPREAPLGEEQRREGSAEVPGHTIHDVLGDDPGDGTSDAPSDAPSDEEVEVMLALLAAEPSQYSDWSQRLSSPGVKLAVVAGGALALTVAGVLAMAIIGALFG